ncbi:MAG: dienelactone hydrolase family protein [Chloroflexi bacterium]|nr:dienelactone hydrolase family protein [Chloroflexota bacterium]
MIQQPLTFEKQITKSIHLNYLLALPRAYTADEMKRFPFILSLHGVGERGNDLEKLKLHGLPQFLQTQDDFPFIVIAPQCPTDSDWSIEMDALGALLEESKRSYRIDQSRVYLTGLSMGGRGALQLAALQPEQFAALVPICPSRPEILKRPERVAQLKSIPMWFFHGAQDPVIPVDQSIQLVDELRALGAPVQLTIYPDAEHNAWQRTYANPKLYAWLLKQKREYL